MENSGHRKFEIKSVPNWKVRIWKALNFGCYQYHFFLNFDVF